MEERTAGPEPWVETLVEQHRRFLAFVERRVGNREAAEEIVQNAFVRGLERGADVRDGESAVAWFYRVLRNAIVDHYRRRGVERAAAERLAREAGPGEPAEDPELHRTACECILDLLPTLKPEYAEALRRVDLDGEPVAAYATESGITPNNASVRLHRARRALRDRVVQCCATCADHGCVDCACDRAPS